LGQIEHKVWNDFYRQLLRIRKEQIMPHLRGIGSTRSSLTMLSERMLLAAWILPDTAQLALLANLADQPCQDSIQMSGKLLYSAPARTVNQLGERMPPWSAAWFLTE